MAQIAYRVASIDDLHNALDCIASANTNIIVNIPKYSSTTVDGTLLANVSFSNLHSSNPYVHNDAFFSIYKKTATVHNSSPSITKTFIWVAFYQGISTEEGTIENVQQIPRVIDYVCTQGQDYANRTYFGNVSGSLKLINVLDISSGGDYYLFFGDDYISIVKYTLNSAVEYLTFSSRVADYARGTVGGHDMGGYILSSSSEIVRQSDFNIMSKIHSVNKLLWYNENFPPYDESGTWYKEDSIDRFYCSIPYNDLNGYSETIKIGLEEIIVKYNFSKQWYARCTCSLLFDSEDTNKLPNYNNIVHNLDDDASPIMSNTLNGISLLLPNYFFIDIAPLSTHEYKYIFDTPEMCYCSMYNMLSGRIVEQNYPTKGNKFMCFSLSSSNEKVRKNNYYKGLAFMLPIRYDRIVVDEGSASIKEI